MNAVAYITTRNHEADAAHLNAQGLRIAIETEADGTPHRSSRSRHQME